MDFVTVGEERFRQKALKHQKQVQTSWQAGSQGFRTVALLTVAQSLVWWRCIERSVFSRFHCKVKFADEESWRCHHISVSAGGGIGASDAGKRIYESSENLIRTCEVGCVICVHSAHLCKTCPYQIGITSNFPIEFQSWVAAFFFKRWLQRFFIASVSCLMTGKLLRWQVTIRTMGTWVSSLVRSFGGRWFYDSSHKCTFCAICLAYINLQKAKTDKQNSCPQLLWGNLWKETFVSSF